MADKIFFDSPTGELVIDGKRYKASFVRKGLKGHQGNLVFKEKPEDYEKRLLKAADYLAEKTPNLTVRDLIAEALKQYTPREIAALEKKIKKKAKVKRERGCISLNIGGQIIAIVH